MKKIWIFIKWFFLAIASIFMGGSVYSSKEKPIGKNEKLIAAIMFLGVIAIIVVLTKIRQL